jgi:hypothetical protein
VVGAQSAVGRIEEIPSIPDKSCVNRDAAANLPKTHGTGNGAQPPSYPQPLLAAHA